MYANRIAINLNHRVCGQAMPWHIHHNRRRRGVRRRMATSVFFCKYPKLRYFRSDDPNYLTLSRSFLFSQCLAKKPALANKAKQFFCCSLSLSVWIYWIVRYLLLCLNSSVTLVRNWNYLKPIISNKLKFHYNSSTLACGSLTSHFGIIMQRFKCGRVQGQVIVVHSPACKQYSWQI